MRLQAVRVAVRQRFQLRRCRRSGIRARSQGQQDRRRKTTTYILALAQIFIAYLSRYVFPKNRFLSKVVFPLLFIFPLNLLALLFDVLLPTRYEYYSNNVVLSRTKVPV
jgi:hypothetical protein